MSRHFAVLGKSNLAASAVVPGVAPPALAPAVKAPVPPASYVELIRRVFHGCSVVAVVGCGIDDAEGVCDDIAAELAASGKRVVVVSAKKLLNLSEYSLSDNNPDGATPESGFVPGAVPGSAPNVWHWPAPAQQLRFFRSPSVPRQSPPDPDKWLSLLRQNFDSVLFSCPALEPEDGKPGPETGITDIAAAAGMTVLVVEAGRTTRQRILHDQRALQSRGARLAGCILVRRK